MSVKLPEHSVFAFSAAPRWMSCAGSMAFPGNTVEAEDGGWYANQGTAAHTVASEVLKGKGKTDADLYVGETLIVGKDNIEIDQDFANAVQSYVDDVERRALGGYLMVEQQVTLEGVEGFDASNYGTSDAIMALDRRGNLPAYGMVEDLKFGQGEKVYAWTYAQEDSPFTMVHYIDDEAHEVVPNYQLMMYALAALADIRLLVDDPAFIRIVIHQPRLNSVQELDIPIAVLERFTLFAADALKTAEGAKALSWMKALDSPHLFKPSDKACRWCKAAAVCPALQKYLQREASDDFEVISEVPAVPNDATRIGRLLPRLPLVELWVKAVKAKGAELVAAGIKVLGPDGQPYKFVEGDLGDRKWTNPKAAEELLLAQLGDAAYVKKLLTAPAAGKLLDKKKTKNAWNDMFVPLIGRAPGKPVLALGSDTRPPYSVSADADEFDNVSDEE